jgi:hypothetical protein
MIFTQTLGFFNLYLLYHIFLSYSSGTTIGNIIVELLFLILNTLYIINSLAKKVENILDIDVETKKKFQFQRTSTIFMKIKKTMGTKSLIIIALGIAFGYHCVMLGSYLNQPMVLIQAWIGNTVSLSTFYHRVILFISLLLIVIVMIQFRYSKSFRDMCLNRYSFRHAVQMFGGLFRRPDSETPSAVEEVGDKVKEGFVQIGQKMKDNISKFGDKVKSSRESQRQKWSSRKKKSDNPNEEQDSN